MASTQVITLKINTMVNGQNQVGELSVKLDDLSKAARIARNTLETGKLNANALNLAAVTTIASQAQSAISGFQSALKSLSDAYAVQATAERQLETAMRNTMGATDAQIQSIKDLCSAQQQLGVIGDEVQLKGAQELATYLEQTETLKKLIPVMNDMCAQQFGLATTGENAASVATMLGKVMNGQVNALSRYGYKFDEAQEKILKFGTEEQRAAVLAEVVSQSVGGMNQALAETNPGRMQQLSNAIGDVKERLGEVATSAMPFVTLAANATLALGGIVKLTGGIKAATAAMTAWSAAGMQSAGVLKIMAPITAMETRCVQMLTTSFRISTVAARGLAAAIKGLLCGTVVGAAIVALGMALEYLLTGTTSAKDAIEDMTGAQQKAMTSAERYAQTMRNVHERASEAAAKEITELDKLYKVASDETETRKKRIQALKELKSEYPDYFSKLNTEKINVNDLSAAYNALRNDIQKAAMARAAFDQMVENNKKVLDLDKQIADANTEVDAKTDNYNAARANNPNPTPTTDWSKAGRGAQTNDWSQVGVSTNDSYAQLNSDLTEAAALRELGHAQNHRAALMKERQDLLEDNARLSEIADQDVEIRRGTGPTGTTTKDTKPDPTFDEIKGRDIKTLGDFETAISDLGKVRKAAAQDQISEIDAYIEKLKAERDAWEQATMRKGESGPVLPGITSAAGAPTIDTKAVAIPTRLEIDTTTIDDARQKLAKLVEDMPTPFESMQNAWGSVKNVASAMDSLNGVLKDNATLWERISSLVDGLMGLYEGFTSLINMITIAEQASMAAKQANIGVTNAETTAEVTNAAAKFMSAHAWIPWVGVALAGASIAAMLATMAGLPKFADGGIAYGPTLGLFGEYAGASHNPEVVAPLDKLRDMIGGGEGISGEVDFKLRGDVLYGALKRYTNKMDRT